MKKNSLVVKDNVLINASYNLEVTEQRLMLLAIVHARDTGQGITADSVLQISASDYASQFNVTKEASYLALKQAVDSLFQRQFTFTESYKDTIKKVKSRWVSRISYIDKFAMLEITFAPDVVPFITRLEKHFTSYELTQISQLTSKYSIRLYELVIAWKTTGELKNILLDDFRERMGLDHDEYKTIDNLKRRVLDPAIKQINLYTDIELSYEQHKRGRIITGFSFSFKMNNLIPKRKDVIKSEIKLTEKQIPFFAHKLAHDDRFSTKYAEIGEEYSDLEKRLTKKLTDQKFIVKHLKDLERVGFKKNGQ